MRAEPTGIRATPLDPLHAVMALEDASDREEIFEVLLRAARSQARFAALLSVHGDHIRGRRAIGEAGLDGSRVETLRFPRKTVPSFEAAIGSRAPSVGPLTSTEPFVEGLLDLLGGPTPTALVLPVTVGTRTVALIIAHRGAAAITLDQVAALFPLVNASSPALARVLASRSKAAASSKPVRADTSAGYDIEVIIPDATKKRSALEAHRKSEAWEDLVDAIRELIRDGMDTGDPDEDEQLELLFELGRIEADRLGRPDRAIEAWRSAQSIDAGDDRVLDALEALFVQQGSWLECVELVEKRAAMAEQPQQRIAMLLNLAAIARERLDDDERAAAAYERILNWEPDHEIASRELESLYWARKEWEPLAALLLDRASRHEDPEHSIAALESVAQMYEEKVGDARAAFLVWLAVVRREPAREHPLGQLDRLGPIADAWDEVVAECRSLAEELETLHPEIAADVWRLVGRWSRDHLVNRDEAVRALDRAVRLESDSETLTELLDLLRADGRWIDLASVISERAESEADLRRRSELYAELGAVYDTQLHQDADAVTFYERARALEPESRVVLAALHRLYTQSETWDLLCDVLPRLIAVLDPATERAWLVELLVQHGTLLAEHLGKPEDAVRAFSDVLAFEPKHAAAFRGIQRVHQATGQTEALLDATEAEVDTAPRADQLERYGEIAAAWQERGDFARAVACWQKLLALEPRNVVAQRGLVAALHGNEQWGSLIVAQRALLPLLPNPSERIVVLLDLANLLDTRLDDVDGAIAVYREVLALDRAHRVALDRLAQLHDRAGQLAPAIEVLQQLLEATPEPRARAELFQRLGQVHLTARDLVNARLNLAQAINLDLDNPRAHEGIARLHLLQDELVPAGEELVRAAQLSLDQQNKIRCLADAAWVFRHRLRDVERARQCLHLILELEPEHADAKQALAELLQDAGQWETLWPHLEEQVARANEDASIPAGDRHEILLRAARCAVELSKFQVAIELYDQASAFDPSPATMIERAEALFRSKNLDAAAAAYQTIVLKHAQAIERPQLAAVYRRLAEIHTALGKISQAQLFHQKVLDLEPSHRATHADLAELHLGRNRYDEAIASWRSASATAPLAEKITYLERIGDLYRGKLKNAPRAMSTYVEALELDAKNRRALQRLLDLQSEGGQWKAAVETIGRFLDHETDPARRAAYFLASAEIKRSELKDRTGALEHYESALDELFREQPLPPATRTRALDVFKIASELITADNNWKLLEQSYRRMIKRVPKDDPALLQLWDGLGDIYRSRLQHYQSAIEAFEIAHALDAEKSPQRARALAELYAALGTVQPQQVSQRAAKLVETDPTNPDAYRALGRTSLEAGRIDEAWCVARALVFLKKANSEEEALYRRYQGHETRKATGILDEDSWAFVRHAEEDRTLSAIFALTWEAIVPLRAGPPKAFELKSKDRMPVEDGTRVIAKIFRHASRVLNVALPDVYVQPRRSGRLLLANCVERGRLVPAVIVGRDLMTGYRDTEIAASVGSMLALLRPPYYLKLTLATVDELEAVIAAAAQLVGKPGVGRPQLEPLTTTFAGEMQNRLTRATGEVLHGLVQRLPDQLDLARWRNTVDAGAQRAGLLVCGELAAAARMVSSESTTLGGQRPNQRMQDLVSYSVSPSYFSARRHLGVAVG